MSNTKPQLSEEMEKRLEECECTGYTCNHETAEDHYIINKHFLATALDEQRATFIGLLENEIVLTPKQSGNLNYDGLENEYFDGKNYGIKRAITILNGKEKNDNN